MLNTNVTRINITVPKSLLVELEKEIPPRGKSGFISTAIEEKLIRERRQTALRELAKLPATFSAIKDSVGYVRKTRKEDDAKRSKEQV